MPFRASWKMAYRRELQTAQARRSKQPSGTGFRGCCWLEPGRRRARSKRGTETGSMRTIPRLRGYSKKETACMLPLWMESLLNCAGDTQSWEQLCSRGWEGWRRGGVWSWQRPCRCMQTQETNMNFIALLKLPMGLRLEHHSLWGVEMAKLS